MSTLPVKKQGLVVQEVGEEAVVLSPRDGQVIHLTSIAAFVLGKCDGRSSFSEVCDAIGEKFPCSTPKGELVANLQALEDAGLLQSEGVTRREFGELVAKVAVPTLMAAALATPAAAQSCFIGNAACLPQCGQPCAAAMGLGCNNICTERYLRNDANGGNGSVGVFPAEQIGNSFCRTIVRFDADCDTARDLATDGQDYRCCS